MRRSRQTPDQAGFRRQIRATSCAFESAIGFASRGKGLRFSMANQIQLNLRDINQLFNTIDPSPFPEKDLDRSAEDFILSWAQEFPIDAPVDLIVYLRKLPEGHRAKHLVEEAI